MNSVFLIILILQLKNAFFLNLKSDLILGLNLIVYLNFLHKNVSPTVFSLTPPLNKTLLDLRLNKNWETDFRCHCRISFKACCHCSAFTFASSQILPVYFVPT